MKRIVGLIVLAHLAGNIFAQKIDQKNVPAVILNSFQVKFPTADDVDWRLDKGNYRVNFEVNDKDHELRLNDRGKIVKHKQDLYVSEIPKNVLETIKSKVQFFDIKDADLLTENGETVYKINFEIDDKDHDFWISENGKLLKYIWELRDNEVPETILSTIKNNYGSLDIDDANYIENKGKVTYYLKGEINDKDHKFIYDKNGRLLKHEQDLRNSEIPAPVMNTVREGYKDYEIRDADLTEENGKTTYDIELKKSKDRIHVILNTDGKILKVKN